MNEMSEFFEWHFIIFQQTFDFLMNFSNPSAAENVIQLMKKEKPFMTFVSLAHCIIWHYWLLLSCFSVGGIICFPISMI